MGQDIDAAREALKSVPPAAGKRPPTEGEREPGAAGPHSPGSPAPRNETGPESGGYDNRPPHPTADNAKGGYGAG